jgi:hypothetical protein
MKHRLLGFKFNRATFLLCRCQPSSLSPLCASQPCSLKPPYAGQIRRHFPPCAGQPCSLTPPYADQLGRLFPPCAGQPCNQDNCPVTSDSGHPPSCRQDSTNNTVTTPLEQASNFHTTTLALLWLIWVLHFCSPLARIYSNGSWEGTRYKKKLPSLPSVS